MGQIISSAVAGDELSAIGLGSCIGLVIADRIAGVAGLAHVVLPDSAGKAGPPGKYADLAVPELIAELTAMGAVKRRLEAVIAGGAKMFATGSGLDIGSRNTEQVLAALKTAKVPVRAQDTGGNRGRTARLTVGVGVSAQPAGGARIDLLSLQRIGRCSNVQTTTPTAA